MHYRASSRGGRYGSCPQVEREGQRPHGYPKIAGRDHVRAPKRPNRHVGVWPLLPARARKVSGPQIPLKRLKFMRHFKGIFGDNIREFESSRPSQAVGLHAPAHAGPFLWVPLRGFSFGRLSWRPHLSAAVVGPGIGQSEPPWLTAR